MGFLRHIAHFQKHCDVLREPLLIEIQFTQ
jgi:hypothetical protein